MRCNTALSVTAWSGIVCCDSNFLEVVSQNYQAAKAGRSFVTTTNQAPMWDFSHLLKESSTMPNLENTIHLPITMDALTSNTFKAKIRCNIISPMSGNRKQILSYWAEAHDATCAAKCDYNRQNSWLSMMEQVIFIFRTTIMAQNGEITKESFCTWILLLFTPHMPLSQVNNPPSCYSTLAHDWRSGPSLDRPPTCQKKMAMNWGRPLKIRGILETQNHVWLPYQFYENIATQI